MGIAENAKNKAQDLKGQAKEAFGGATNNSDLESEGQADQAIAAVKDAVADAADKVQEGVEAVKNKLTGK